jgi:hypothetical protein
MANTADYATFGFPALSSVSDNRFNQYFEITFRLIKYMSRLIQSYALNYASTMPSLKKRYLELKNARNKYSAVCNQKFWSNWKENDLFII